MMNILDNVKYLGRTFSKEDFLIIWTCVSLAAKFCMIMIYLTTRI